MRNLILFSTLMLGGLLICSAQVRVDSIIIVRDSFGVAHIYAPTDEEVNYGLAWAMAEDDFQTVQEQLLAVRGRLAEVKGKSGAILDVAAHIADVAKVVDSRYEEDLSPKYKAILDAYAQGMNDYAASHPRQVMRKNLFPAQSKDLLKGYLLGLMFMTSAQKPLGLILSGDIANYEQTNLPQGSNGMAVSRRRTTDGKTYLALNSHQPLEGMYSWYEAHLVSGEGMNFLGAGFPGSVGMFIGTNKYLGWGHMLNFPDLSDVYKLTMHPKEKRSYRFDGQWEKLEPYPIKLKVKVLGFIRLGIKQKYYRSKYGFTLKGKTGYYSIRFPSSLDIRAGEQWYHMTRAKNFDEFKIALKRQALPGMNIVYADREDNIFYLSNGHFPYRDSLYDWDKVLPGDTSATLWPANQYHPLEDLAQKLNPDCGYVFNTNNSPFNCTCYAENPSKIDEQSRMGYQMMDNNRSLRFQELMAAQEKLDYNTFKKIKFDRTFTDSTFNQYAVNFLDIRRLDPEKYPEIADAILVLQNWDLSTDPGSAGASLAAMSYKYLAKKLREEDRLRPGNVLQEAEMAKSLEYARKHLKKHFGSIQVPLGELQRHVRGEVNLPVGGMPEILAAMYTGKAKKGRFHSRAGESYISLIRYDEQGPELETISPYGASAREGDPHFTDQMPLYVNQKLKPMTLDWSEVLLKAERIYHPGGKEISSQGKISR